MVDYSEIITLLYAVGNVTSSVTLVLLNKRVFSNGFYYPMTLSFFHFVFTIGFYEALRVCGVYKRPEQPMPQFEKFKVGFAGFSAGGHLTVHITTAWGSRTYPRVDAADDLPCRPDFSMPIYPWKLLLNNDAGATQLAPEVSNVSAATPPLRFR